MTSTLPPSTTTPTTAPSTAPSSTRGAPVPDARQAPGWTPRAPFELLADQLNALEAWNRDRRATEQLLADVGTNREAMLDARRRAGAVRREAEAVRLRSGDVQRAAEDLLAAPPRARALVVHRQAWLRTKVGAALEQAGVDVLGLLEDGADGVGWAVVDQPDLVLLDEMLPTLPGREVVRRVRAFSPGSVVAVQVGYDDAVQPMLDAGAHLAVPRRVPPAELAAQLLATLG